MKMSIYCIKDDRMEWLTPTFEANDEVAMRNFSHAVMSSNSILTTHKNDFTLYKIGNYDTHTGKVTSCIPSIIISGGDINIG